MGKRQRVLYIIQPKENMFSIEQCIHPHQELTCDFGKLFYNLFLCLALGNGAHKESVVCDRDAHTNVFARANFMIVVLQRKMKLLTCTFPN